MSDANYSDELGLLSSAPAEAESQLHSLELAAGDFSFNVNANKQNSWVLMKMDTSIR